MSLAYLITVAIANVTAQTFEMTDGSDKAVQLYLLSADPADRERKMRVCIDLFRRNLVKTSALLVAKLANDTYWFSQCFSKVMKAISEFAVNVNEVMRSADNISRKVAALVRLLAQRLKSVRKFMVDLDSFTDWHREFSTMIENIIKAATGELSNYVSGAILIMHQQIFDLAQWVGEKVRDFILLYVYKYVFQVQALLEEVVDQVKKYAKKGSSGVQIEAEVDIVWDNGLALIVG